MDINGQSKQLHNCSIDGCTHLALIFSEPPRCCAHIENLDAWFDNVLSETVAHSIPNSAQTIADPERIFTAFSAHEIYRGLLLNNPVGQDLYADFQNRVDPRKEVSFSFDDVVYFVLIAAASGVIGNFAYEVLQSIVRKLNKKHNSRKLEDTFEEVVRETKYEELRIRYHADSLRKTEATSELETEINTRYRLVMFKEIRRRQTKRRTRSE